MKKISTFFAMALLALCVMPVQAQDDTFFADKFPYQQPPLVSHIYPLWLDGTSEAYYNVTPYIVQDLRPNGTYNPAPTPNTGQRFLDVWSATYVFDNPGDLGALAQIGNYMSLTATGTWAGGGFQLLDTTSAAYQINLTAMDDTYRFHMAVRKKVTTPCEFWLMGGGDSQHFFYSDAKQEARFCVGVGTNADNSKNITPNFVANQWYIIDMPIATLRTLSNSQVGGWDNLAPIRKGYYLAYTFGTLNSTAAGNNLQFDATFYYSTTPPPASVDHVIADTQLRVMITENTVNVLNANAPIEVYNVAGSKVLSTVRAGFGKDELPGQGVYIIKSGSAFAKVLIN